MVSDILLGWPERKQEDCPDIWVCGHGTLLGAIFPQNAEKAEEVMGNTRPSLTQTEVKAIAYSHAERILGSIVTDQDVTYFYSSYSRTRGPAPFSLVNIWCKLLRRHWPKYQDRRDYRECV